MGRIEKNHWFVKEDIFSISLMRFHVSFQQVMKEDIIFWRVTVTNSDMEKLYLNFPNLEDCFFFTENFINNSHDFNEIKEKRKEYRKIKKEVGKTKVKRIERINNKKN